MKFSSVQPFNFQDVEKKGRTPFEVDRAADCEVEIRTVDLHATIDAIWRIAATRIIGATARRVRDLVRAEARAQADMDARRWWPGDVDFRSA